MKINFYENILHRKLKWRTWIYQRKSEDNFIQRIEDIFGKTEDKNQNDLLLCYGNWSNSKQMKHIMPTKGVGLKKAISKKYQVLMIDEYKTSKLCNKCENELINYKDKNNKKIHRLLVCMHCKSKNKCDGLESEIITFINRDMNACLNMLKLSSEWIKDKTRNINYSRKSIIQKPKIITEITDSDPKKGKTELIYCFY